MHGGRQLLLSGAHSACSSSLFLAHIESGAVLVRWRGLVRDGGYDVWATLVGILPVHMYTPKETPPFLYQIYEL
jgi:hypothetical protein